MNKYLKIGLCLLLTIFVFTGCENKANETKKEDDNSLSVYEYHYYDNDFNHTEDFIVKYDKLLTVMMKYMRIFIVLY